MPSSGLSGVLDSALVRSLGASAFLDRTAHSPGIAHQPLRDDIHRGLVLHRISDGGEAGGGGGDVDAIVRFFTSVPAGVATVTLSGTWDSKVATIERWKAAGIPPEIRAAAFVPYHFLVQGDGTVAQMLPLERGGAHAVNYNKNGLGVAFIGDFRATDPTAAQLAAGVAVCTAVLRRLPHAVAGTLPLYGHDEVRDEPKQCPGPRFPLADMKRRIRSAASAPPVA